MSVCKGCGKPIVWGVTPLGSKVPLDPSAPVYMIQTGQDEAGPLRIAQLPKETAMVTHFKTCANADEFSGSKRRTATQQPGRSLQ